MSQLVQDQVASGKARIVDAPAQPGTTPECDRSFGLPKEVYIATVAGYLGFLAIMAGAFMNPVLVIPMVIFTFFIVAGFGVPTIWTRMKGNDSKPLSMGQFENDGIMTLTGRLSPREAAVQVLILPILVVLWACAVVVIAALV